MPRLLCLSGSQKMQNMALHYPLVTTTQHCIYSGVRIVQKLLVCNDENIPIRMRGWSSPYYSQPVFECSTFLIRQSSSNGLSILNEWKK